MSGSLYQYTPYSLEGPSPTAGFASGFGAGQAAETSALRMDEARQLAQMREFANQRAQAAEQRTAQRFPLDMKAAGLGVSRTQQLLPLEVRRGELGVRELEQNIADRAAALAALRAQVAPSMVTPGAVPTQATPGVAVPGAVPGFMAPEAAPAAAAPGPQSSRYFPNIDLDRRHAGVPGSYQTAQYGSGVMSDADPEEPADLTGRGAPVGMPVQSAPPTVGVTPPQAPAPGEMETGLITLPPPEPGSALARFLERQTPEQLQAIIDRGTPTTGTARGYAGPGRRVVPAGAASLAAAAREELARRPGAPTTPGAARAPATGRETIAEFEAARSLDDATQRRPSTSAPTQTAADAAVSRGESPSVPYILEPLRIGSDQRRLTTEYQQLQRRYNTALAARDRAGVDQAIARMNEINQELTYLNGMTALTQFRNGDAAPLAGVLHEESGRRLSFQPRSDGTFNLFLDGRLSRPGVTRDEIETAARLQFDTRFQAQIQQQQTQRVALGFLAAQEQIKQTARTNAESLLEVVKSNLRPDLDVQRITDANGQQMIVVTDKRTGEQVGGARIIQVPPRPGSPRGAQPTFTIEPLPVGQR
jgi:hypothetical protein